MRLQRSIGNARVGDVLELARCRDGSDPACGRCGHAQAGRRDGELVEDHAGALASAVAARRQLARQPEPSPQTGPEPGKAPPFTGVILIWKNGRKY